MSEILNDEQLVELSLNEDKEFFSELVEKYQVKLTRYIKRISNLSTEEIEDILQNSFIRAYRNLNNFDNKLKFSSWIYRIVHNEVIDTYRKSFSKGRDNLIKIDEGAIRNISDDFDTVSLSEEFFTEKYIQLALDRIDIKYREVIILRYFEEKNYQEISDILKKPMNTIATLLSRAKKQMRNEINSFTNNTYEHEK